MSSTRLLPAENELRNRFDGRIVWVLALLFSIYICNCLPESQNSHAQSKGAIKLQNLATPHQSRVFIYGKIPINSAEKDLLVTIKGIGPSLAEKIVAARKNGLYFHDQEDLQNLPTIGVKRAAYLASQVSFTTH